VGVTAMAWVSDLKGVNLRPGFAETRSLAGENLGGEAVRHICNPWSDQSRRSPKSRKHRLRARNLKLATCNLDGY
jgi:hypothetical protein